MLCPPVSRWWCRWIGSLFLLMQLPMLDAAAAVPRGSIHCPGCRWCLSPSAADPRYQWLASMPVTRPGIAEPPRVSAVDIVPFVPPLPVHARRFVPWVPWLPILICCHCCHCCHNSLYILFWFFTSVFHAAESCYMVCIMLYYSFYIFMATMAT